MDIIKWIETKPFVLESNFLFISEINLQGYCNETIGIGITEEEYLLSGRIENNVRCLQNIWS